MTFAYTVRAEFELPERRRDYLSWLADGHAADVVAAGAAEARVITLDERTVEVRYLFPSASAFAAYEAGPAVALRADGAARFGTPDVRFSRSTGEVVTEITG
ncbi:DUF4286 domain-containing protein [Pilimelia anulata]|nr:DUF4286 domain-containing protein [Pilimelia anulata]